MEVDLHESLMELYPNLSYAMSNNDYDTLIWLDTSVPKPSKETLLQRSQEIINAKPLKDLRQERNKRLAEVDWIFSEDYSIDDDSYQQWLTYRKALRDLPSATEDPENPVWPEQPAMPSGTTENKDLTRELRIENNRLKSKVTILENRQTHFNTLLVNLIGRIETLERPT
jgi:hypothetical protein